MYLPYFLVNITKGDCLYLFHSDNKFRLDLAFFQGQGTRNVRRTLETVTSRQDVVTMATGTGGPAGVTGCMEAQETGSMEAQGTAPMIHSRTGHMEALGTGCMEALGTAPMIVISSTSWSGPRSERDR